MLTKRRQALALETCLPAGRLLIENGSNMERVSDTLSRIAKSVGFRGFQVFTTVTGIVVGTISEPDAQVITIRHRKNNLSKTVDVNRASREPARRRIDVPQVLVKSRETDHQKMSKWQSQYESFAAAILSGASMIVFTGNASDSWAGFLAGGVGYGAFSYLLQKFKIQYLGEFCSSLIIGILAVIFVKMHLANNTNDIIISVVMPLASGVPLTNAARDLASGNLISGSTRGIEAILTAVLTGSAIATVLHFN